MNPISTVVVVVVVMLMMRFFAKQSKQAPKTDADGYTVLRMSVLYEVIGWIGGVMILALTTAIFLFSVKSAGTSDDLVGTIFGVAVFSIFFALCALLILSRRKSYIRFDNEKIEVHGITKKTKEIRWASIKTIVFTPKRTLKLSDGNTNVRVYYSLIGFQTFVERMKEKVAPEIIGDATEKIEKMYQHFNVQ